MEYNSVIKIADGGPVDVDSHFEEAVENFPEALEEDSGQILSSAGNAGSVSKPSR